MLYKNLIVVKKKSHLNRFLFSDFFCQIIKIKKKKFLSNSCEYGDPTRIILLYVNININNNINNNSAHKMVS